MKIKTFSLVILLFISAIGFTAPIEDFTTVYTRAELNPAVQKQAEQLASTLGHPFRIYTNDYKFIEAKGVENGQVVYTVIVDRYNIYNGAYTAFYNDVVSTFNLAASRIDYGNGNIVDNTGGIYNTVKSSRGMTGLWLLIPEWTNDKVYAFDAQTGDLIDPDFIPSTPTTLQSPRHAFESPWGTIMVADQISDAVQEFDTSGVFIRTYAPAGGPNPSILDNIRGVFFRPDRKLLVTVGSGANQNTVQLFDTGGVSLGAFIPVGNLSSPFYIIQRNSEYLIGNSNAPNDVQKFDLSGTFISNFIVSSNLAFPQQIIRLQNGNLVICGFSSPSGLVFFDSAGTYISTINAVTGNRGVYRLGNGNYLTTNGTGVHEIDDTTGVLIRTIATASNFQFIDIYNPSGVTGIGNEFTTTDEYKLYDNYPNPFNPVTNIRFAIPKNGFVSLKIYDALGREVSSLVNEFRNAGEYTVNFNASTLVSGVYFYTLKTESFSATKKMMLVK